MAHRHQSTRHVGLQIGLALLVAFGAIFAGAAGWSSAARAADVDETSLKLKEAPERIFVQATCGACHSVDYILTNSVFLDRKGWEGSVNKMINAFGAPIKAEDVPKIVDYLSRNYGK